MSTSQESTTTEQQQNAGASSGQQSDQLLGGQQTTQMQSSGDTDEGFPENTPVAQMTDAERANYFQFQNRQTDNKLSAFKGVTPQQVEEMQAELEGLRNEKLSASDKALKEAANTAAVAAKAEAEAAWRPKYQAAQLKSAAGTVIKDSEQLDAFLAFADPAKFVGDDGEIDTEKVMGHLTALYGQQQQAGGQQQRPAWGQHSGGTPPVKPGEAGKAEASKRFGKST